MPRYSSSSSGSEYGSDSSGDEHLNSDSETSSPRPVRYKNWTIDPRDPQRGLFEENPSETGSDTETEDEGSTLLHGASENMMATLVDRENIPGTTQAIKPRAFERESDILPVAFSRISSSKSEPVNEPRSPSANTPSEGPTTCKRKRLQSQTDVSTVFRPDL